MPPIKYVGALLLTVLLLALPARATPIGNPIVNVHTGASLESNHVLKSTGGYLNGFAVTATSTAGYVLFFDATSAPADGAVTPVLCYYVPAEPLTAGATWFQYPVPFVNGIVVVFSTTGCLTKTASATAFFQAQVQ